MNFPVCSSSAVSSSRQQHTPNLSAGGDPNHSHQPSPVTGSAGGFPGLTDSGLNTAGLAHFNPYSRPGTFNPASSSGASGSSGSFFTRSNLLQSGTLPVGVIRPLTRPDVTSAATVGSTGVPPVSHQPAGGLTSASGLVGSGQRLKVEDALSYLDQVKIVFASRAQVYSDFLDIMKDFKSQAIDTPGVIQRVSSLFRGHPSLIVGFNTFLPPGYRIDVDNTGERVSICTPSGQSQIIASATVEGSTARAESGATLTTPSCSQPLSQLSLESLAAHHQPNISPRPAGPPIEFNHAINYVNKIKARFQHKPEVYKQFLEILHSYQKEQRDLKSCAVPLSRKPLTESAVYASVARLFSNEEDLLREFSQFLPDATGAGMFSSVQSHLTMVTATQQSQLASPPSAASAVIEDPPTATLVSAEQGSSATSDSPVPTSSKKNPSSFRSDASASTPAKRVRHCPATELAHAVSFAEAAKYGTLSEYQFFDKVRKALKSDEVYENFLRCLVLFNQELICKSELLELVQPFLGKYPELFKWMKDFMGCNERTGYCEEIPQNQAQLERISSDLAMEIDYASCKRFGVSYRALPDSYVHPKCGGRTELCNSVLNDTWVSFPSWSSEEGSYISSKKTQYEEFIYRTEDERFELDIVIEVNRSAIQALECVRRRLARMSSEEAKKFKLDETLGGRSGALMTRAIKRIYGEKFTDIIDGLRRNPSVAVPVVLKRLKAKDEEWREAQKGFNRIWREQNQKYYLKSLDHQALTFKQNDLKLIRSKALVNQIEVLYDERHEKIEEAVTPVPSGPHMTILYPSLHSIFYDVNDLLIHHVKRQTSIQKEEKSKIKKLLRQTIPDLFGFRREDLSDDEDDLTEGGYPSDESGEKNSNGKKIGAGRAATRIQSENEKPHEIKHPESESQQQKVSCGYSLLFTPNAWYIFLRLHQLLCERLAKLRQDAEVLAKEKEEAPGKPKSVAAQLRCEPKLPCQPSQYYSCMLTQIKNLLDGQIDNSQFEDNLRDMFATGAFVAFTADKLIHNMVRQLQQIVTEDLCCRCLALYNKSRSVGGAGGLALYSVDRRIQEEAYQAECEHLLTDNNAFKIYFMQEEGKITFELLDTDSCEEDTAESKRWSLYIKNFLDATSLGSFSESFLKQLSKRPVFLSRNIRQVKRANKIFVENGSGETCVLDKSMDSLDSGTTDELPEQAGTSSASSQSSAGRNVRRITADEDMEIQLIPGQWGLRFVANTGDLLLKKGAVGLSKIVVYTHGYVDKVNLNSQWIQVSFSLVAM